ncbi:hypothetical protein ECG_06145 [Echinococcus granulosus]|nr:hypothetical protein ECG_06145 [Echinococcus granulosus]
MCTKGQDGKAVIVGASEGVAASAAELLDSCLQLCMQQLTAFTNHSMSSIALHYCTFAVVQSNVCLLFISATDTDTDMPPTPPPNVAPRHQYQTLLKINSQSHSGTNIFRPNELHHQPGTFIQHITPAHQGGLVSATEKLCTTDTSASESTVIPRKHKRGQLTDGRKNGSKRRNNYRPHFRTDDVTCQLANSLFSHPSLTFLSSAQLTSPHLSPYLLMPLHLGDPHSRGYSV